MKVLKVGVVGSRRRNTEQDKQIIRQALQHLIAKDPEVKVFLVSGGCPLGADRFAEELAIELGLGISVHLPDKSKMSEDTKYEYIKQLFSRNTLIAEECDVLLVVYDGTSSGTKDTIQKTEKLNKPIVYL